MNIKMVPWYHFLQIKKLEKILIKENAGSPSEK